MPRFVFAASFLFLSSLAVSAQTPAPADAEMGKRLPPGEGRDVVMRVCSKCHDPDLAADQQLDADGWKDLVNQMASNGAKGSDADFDQITAYLIKAFPAK